MISFRSKRLRLGAALLASSVAAAAGAQVQYPAGAVVQPLPSGAGEDLSRHLRSLSDQPNNVSALIGAGQSALDLGDPQTALTFFARAEEASPRDARAKAGMGSAFVQMEQPQAALKFFADAELMGMPAQLFAGDRGLAYDMIGDPARAQADYALALRSGSDAEFERRLALSKAITGDRAGALAILDRQLRQQDRAAWRARAFVLALTGDASEATRAVEAVMPNRAAALQPFLARLPQLGPAEKAMAVHFGHFPQQMARSVAPAGRPARGEPALGGISPVVSIGAQDRPARQNPARSPAASSSQAKAPATRTITRTVERIGSRFPIRETITVPVETEPKDDVVVGEARPARPAQHQQAQAIVAGQPRPVQPIAGQGGVVPSRSPAAGAATQQPVQMAASTLNFGNVVAAVQSLGGAEGNASGQNEPRAAAAQAPRIWVQLAASQNKAAFATEFRRLSGKAPGLLSGKTAWTAPFRSTNRLLVGPFETEKEARDLVNELAKLSIDSFSWTSTDGQEIEKIAGR